MQSETDVGGYSIYLGGGHGGTPPYAFFPFEGGKSIAQKKIKTTAENLNKDIEGKNAQKSGSRPYVPRLRTTFRLSSD